MSQIVALCFLIAMIASVIFLSGVAPHWLDDHNKLLKGFVDHDLLAILGVILAITLASAAQIHLKFNDLEERERKIFLTNSRREVKSSSYWLIASFSAAFSIVLAKPLFSSSHIVISLFNGAAVLILIFNILILFDMTAGVFAIPPIIKDPPDASPPSPSPPRSPPGR